MLAVFLMMAVTVNCHAYNPYYPEVKTFVKDDWKLKVRGRVNDKKILDIMFQAKINPAELKEPHILHLCFEDSDGFVLERALIGFYNPYEIITVKGDFLILESTWDAFHSIRLE